MARLGIYEMRAMAALLLRGGEAREEDLAGAFERPGHLRQAIEGLADCRAVVWDKPAFRLRLLPGRCLELLGMSRVTSNQQGMFSEGCLLPELPAIVESPPAVEGPLPSAAGTVAKAAEPVAPVAAYTRDVLEIPKLGTRELGGGNLPLGNGQKLEALPGQTRLSGPARAHFEQRATERAQLVAAQYRADGYLAEKLSPRRRLREELFEGKTPTARKFAVLYASDPDAAREQLGAAIHADNPAANLNTRLQALGVRY